MFYGPWAFATVVDLAYPNWDPIADERSAASPLAVRKGYAFPLGEATHKPLPRACPDSSGQARGGGENLGDRPERHSLSAQQLGGAPLIGLIAR